VNPTGAPAVLVGVTVTVVVVGADPASGLAGVPGVRLLACTADPRRAPGLVGQARPQVVVVGLDGDRETLLAALPEVAARAPDARVLAVSGATPDPAADALAAVRAGATGYVAAGGEAEALAEALRRTAAGEAVFPPGLAETVLAARGGSVEVRAHLSPREADVLRLVVDGLTARQIATRLVLSPRTVEHHIQRVLRRLGVPNRAALVRHAIEHGLA
jgi:DNA-binding NarL/FixJ family response regulator